MDAQILVLFAWWALRIRDVGSSKSRGAFALQILAPLLLILAPSAFGPHITNPPPPPFSDLWNPCMCIVDMVVPFLVSLKSRLAFQIIPKYNWYVNFILKLHSNLSTITILKSFNLRYFLKYITRKRRGT